MNLNPGLAWQEQQSTRRLFCHQQIGLNFKEGTSEVLHLEHSFVRCWKWETLFT
jgi:hypothetical protein